MNRLRDQVVFVTGASSGIGSACARAFAGAGSRLLLAARRVERIEAGISELERLGAPAVRALRMDVRSSESVRTQLDRLPDEWRPIDVLVANAGLSRGLDPLHEGELRDWEEMIDTNVRGLLHVDRAVVPGMVQRRRGTVIHIGSIAGRQVYPGGSVYCATKHAVRALTDALRIDLLGSGVRVSSVDPGLVRTEFSEVRFRGDRKRAEAVYRGVQPLTGDDVAEVVVFAASRPAHVVLAETLVLPIDQASAVHVDRKE